MTSMTFLTYGQMKMLDNIDKAETKNLVAQSNERRKAREDEIATLRKELNRMAKEAADNNKKAKADAEEEGPAGGAAAEIGGRIARAVAISSRFLSAKSFQRDRLEKNTANMVKEQKEANQKLDRIADSQERTAAQTSQVTLTVIPGAF